MRQSWRVAVQSPQEAYALKQWLSNISVVEKHVESVLKIRLLGPIHRSSNLIGLAGALEFTFLTNPQVVLTLEPRPRHTDSVMTDTLGAVAI